MHSGVWKGEIYTILYVEIYQWLNVFSMCSGHTEDYQIGICCLSSMTKQSTVRSYRKDCLVARNQDNVSKWSDMSTVVSVS